VESARVPAERFRLLHPDLVPQRREVLAHAASMLVQMGLDDTLVAASPVHQRLARVVLASSDVIEWVPAHGVGASEPTGYDAQLGVVRVGGDRGAVFLSGLLIAYLDVLENAARMGTTLPHEDWRTLMWAPTALFDHVLGRAPAGMTITIPAARGAEYLPAERWRAGHRLFFALLQAVRFAVSGLLRDRAGEDFELAMSLLRAASVALRFAVGDGAVALVDTRDHRYLWKVVDQLRFIVPRARHERFAAALRALNVPGASPVLAAGN
jgi:hypothetical protein